MNINTDFKLELQEKGKQRRKEQQLKKLEKATPRDYYRAEPNRIIDKEREEEQENAQIHMETTADFVSGRDPTGSGMDFIKAEGRTENEMEREEEQEIK